MRIRQKQYFYNNISVFETDKNRYWNNTFQPSEYPVSLGHLNLLQIPANIKSVANPLFSKFLLAADVEMSGIHSL